MILGCDAAGLDPDGNEVVVHAIIGDPDWRGDETLDPKRTLLSEKHQGAFAERLIVPERNLIPKPEGMSFEQAACMPTAWLTAYRMLFVTGAFAPGETVLVQGAGGGVASAAIRLGSAAGIRVWATSRSEAKRERALGLGADASFETGARLPERVDGVIETVGEATWGHSLRSLRARRPARRLRRRPAARTRPPSCSASSSCSCSCSARRWARAPSSSACFASAPWAASSPRSTECCPSPTRKRASSRWRRESWSAKSSSPSEGQRRSLTKPEGAAKGRGVAEPHKPPRRALRRSVRERRLGGSLPPALCSERGGRSEPSVLPRAPFVTESGPLAVPARVTGHETT